MSNPVEVADPSAAIPPPGGPTDARAVSASPSMAARLSRGAAWSFIALAISQGASVLSQVVLGYKLSTEFALYMVAVAALSVIGIIRDAGLRKILVVRGADYASLAWPVFLIGTSINVACAIGLVIAAPYLARHSFQTPQPQLVPMMWVIAASVAISSFGAVQASKLAIDLRFKAGAAQIAASGVLRQVSQAVLALCGAGAMSFAWPMLIVAIFDAVSLRWLAGPVPRGAKLSLPIFRELFNLSKWVMLAMFGMVLIYRADGFLVARYEDIGTVVSFYGWALALTIQAQQPFTNLIYGTVLPGFARIAAEPARARAAYLRMVGVVTFATSPAIMCICLACPLGIHLVWRGRWDPAIPAVALILAATPFKSLQACALAFDEAHSRFRRAALLLIADGFTVLVAVGIGIYLGGLVAIACAIAVQRALFNSFHMIYVGHSGGIPIKALMLRTMPPVIAALAIAAACVIPASWLFGASAVKTYWAMAILSLPGVAVYLVGGRYLAPVRWADALEVVRSRGK